MHKYIMSNNVQASVIKPIHQKKVSLNLWSKPLHFYGVNCNKPRKESLIFASQEETCSENERFMKKARVMLFQHLGCCAEFPDLFYL